MERTSNFLIENLRKENKSPKNESKMKITPKNKFLKTPLWKGFSKYLLKDGAKSFS